MLRSRVTRPIGATVALILLAGVATACGDDGDPASGDPAADPATSIRLHEIQVIGSHNSYKQFPREELSSALAALAPDLLAEIDYGHLSLTEQLEDHGIRQFELDVMADPEGGRYAAPAALDVLGIDEPPDPALLEPGFKVLHIQDVDYESSCLTFVACLEEIERWSSANPDHLPVMLMVETKTGSLEVAAADIGIDLAELDVELTSAPDMTPELFEVLEAEITSVFDRGRIITPDDVRGDHETLEAAVLEDGWPTVAESRGKVLFGLVDTGPSADVYRAGAPSLEGRLAFTSGEPGEPDAAFVRVDDSLAAADQLDEWARAGYLIRTRTDVPGVHAAEGDTALRDSALASGAHYLSTDYYVEREDFGTGFVVALPGAAVARCNPVTAPPDCDDAALVEG